MKKKYVKLDFMGAYLITTLNEALVEIRNLYDIHNHETDIIKMSFVEFTDEEYKVLPEFDGFI